MNIKVKTTFYSEKERYNLFFVKVNSGLIIIVLPRAKFLLRQKKWREKEKKLGFLSRKNEGFFLFRELRKKKHFLIKTDKKITILTLKIVAESMSNHSYHVLMLNTIQMLILYWDLFLTMQFACKQKKEKKLN